MNRTADPAGRWTGEWIVAAAALVSAAPMALLIHWVNQAFPAQPERGVTVLSAVFAVVLGAVPVLYAVRRRAAVTPARIGLVVLSTLGILLTAVYLYRAALTCVFPADILIWSESDFVNDILKFRVGYPLYSAQVNNESFPYPPGAQLLTYLLAWLCGHPTSIACYRLIQVGYTLLAGVVALGCCRRLSALGSQPLGEPRLWHAVWLPFCVLIAANSLSNPFAQELHHDALATLLSAVAYWLLLVYVTTRSVRVLALMALVPALGFLVKQSLVLWAVLYGIQLAVFDRPRSLQRMAAFAAAACVSLGAVIAACVALWGEPFVYWVFTVLSRHGVSPLRSIQHALDVWPYFFVGVVGGGVLLRGRRATSLLGPWVIWLVLICIETYTSGVAWMLNHIGPGSLIAGVWFLAALPRLWPAHRVVKRGRFQVETWGRVGGAVALMGLLCSGLGIVQIPIRPFSTDAYRYVREIEREFDGYAARDVLLDAGTWGYLRDGVVMRDRAPSIGERGYSQTGDFSGILARIRARRFAKILVRNFHSPNFWYDYAAWRTPSGIRQALAENYHEIHRIMPVDGQEHGGRYLFSEISVLVPTTE